MKSIVCTATAAVLLGGANVAQAQATTTVASLTETEIRQLPDAELMKRYLACSDASEQGGLSRVDVRACSVIYDALLTRTFRGDFDALLAWATAGNVAVARTAASRRD